MLYSGLVSITFRKLPVEEIIELCQKNSVQGIEWGGDVHVPVGNFSKADQVGELTRAAGLTISAYGSYYRLDSDITPVLDTAKALGASLIRIWAGTESSRETSKERFSKLIELANTCAEKAQTYGLKLSFEMHAGTLNDHPESSALLFRLTHPELSSFWQPLPGFSLEDNLASLSAIKHCLTNIHVFNWQKNQIRFPLNEAFAEWRHYLGFINNLPGNRFVSLEFLPKDDVALFPQEAETLHRLLEVACVPEIHPCLTK